MEIHSKILKQYTREDLKGIWKETLLASLISWTVIFFPILILYFILPLNNELALASHYKSIVIICIITGIYTYIAGILITVGRSQYVLDIIDKKELHISTMFLKYKRFFTIFIFFMLFLPLLFLSSLFFLIPGIIVFLTYGLTPFIIADYPSIGPIKAMKESRQMMKGYKKTFFFLIVSFAGWFILIKIIPVFILNLFHLSENILVITFTEIISSTLFYIYFYTTLGQFYAFINSEEMY